MKYVVMFLMVLFSVECLSSDLSNRLAYFGLSATAGGVLGGAIVCYVCNRDQDAAKVAPCYYRSGVALYGTAAVLSGANIALNYIGNTQGYLDYVEAFSPLAGLLATYGANYCMSLAHDAKIKSEGFVEGRRSLLKPAWGEETV